VSGPAGIDGGTGPIGLPGPTGSAGTGSGGLIKFSSSLDPELPSAVGYLADGNSEVFPVPLPYPLPSARTFVSFSAELLTILIGPNDGDPFIVPPGGTVTFQLFHGVSAVPTFIIVFNENEGGIKAAVVNPEAFAVGDTYHLQVESVGFNLSANVRFSFSATIGVA
jgi:hypothetical protein